MTKLPVRQRGAVCCQELSTGEKAWARDTAELLKALAEPTRLSMITALWSAAEPVCICDFTAAFELSQPTISHHMAKLREAGLVEVTKVGIWAYYRLSARLDPQTRALLDVLV